MRLEEEHLWRCAVETQSVERSLDGLLKAHQIWIERTVGRLPRRTKEFKAVGILSCEAGHCRYEPDQLSSLIGHIDILPHFSIRLFCRRRCATSVSRHSRWRSCSQHVARHHTDDRLAEPRTQAVGLNNQGGTSLHRREIGICEKNENYVTPLAIRHRLTFTDDPSPLQRWLTYDANRPRWSCRVRARASLRLRRGAPKSR